MNATLTQMKHSARNLVAVSLAVILGVMFVTSTLFVGSVFKQSVWNSVAAQYDGADAILTAKDSSKPLTAQTVTAVGAMDGVASAEGRAVAPVLVRAGSRSTYPFMAQLPEAPAIREQLRLSSGRLPAKAGEVVLISDVATPLNVHPGDTVELQPFSSTGALGSNAGRVVVVGVLKSTSFGDMGAPEMYAWATDFAAWEPDAALSSILVTARPGTDAQTLISHLNAGPDLGFIARTRDQAAKESTSNVTGRTDILTGGLLAFALIALFVAGIVIANTFTILIAQRTRNLALLRCIGATRGQIRRSVLAEAAVLGGIASILGIAVGIGIVTGGIRILGAALNTGVIATNAPIPMSAIVVPLLLGIMATMLAAWNPARAATKVAPLDALRPTSLPLFRSRVTRKRVIFTLLLIGGGILLLLAGALMALASPGLGPVLIGVAGGMVSFLGVMTGAVLIVPGTVALLGKIGVRAGAAGAIASSNSARNPRRTTATATALLVAVTLITMMSVGAESIKSTLGKVIDERDPVDVIVANVPQPGAQKSDSGFTTAKLSTVSQTLKTDPNIETTMNVLATDATVNGHSISLFGVDPDTARSLSHAPAQLDGLASGTVIVPKSKATSYDIATGDRLELVSGSRTLQVVAQVSAYRGSSFILTSEDLRKLSPDAMPSQVWASLKPGADAGKTVGAIQDALANVDGISFSGGAETKDSNNRVLDTILLIVTALLGVAVIIALVGVGNTLSLSVIERTRESAILRAIGLTRRQMRGMLAIEGMMIAVVGAALGMVLGTAYGVIGVVTLLGDTWGISIAIPYGRIAEIVIVAIVAGLLASVLPARKALKISPVAALAE